MKLEIEEVISIAGEKYIVLETEIYNEKEYYFMNKLTQEEEPTEQYHIFSPKGENELEAVSNNDTVTVLIPIFQNKLAQRIKENFRGDIIE
ncbi:MAG: hypothetical protein Q4G04_01225 [bacterium]|nr:hypothetical protein [bacterium]